MPKRKIDPFLVDWNNYENVIEINYAPEHPGMKELRNGYLMQVLSTSVIVHRISHFH